MERPENPHDVSSADWMKRATRQLRATPGRGPLASVRMFAASEKDESRAVRRSVGTWWRSSRRGCRDSQTHPLTPSLRALGVDASVPMPCQRLVARHTATACQVCASLSAKTVTPHTLRHAAAMALLRRGVDLTVIALWLGPRINGADRGVLAMRTCGSKSARSLMPPHPASFPIAIGLPIRCWPSSML